MEIVVPSSVVNLQVSPDVSSSQSISDGFTFMIGVGFGGMVTSTLMYVSSEFPVFVHLAINFVSVVRFAEALEPEGPDAKFPPFAVMVQSSAPVELHVIVDGCPVKTVRGFAFRFMVMGT